MAIEEPAHTVIEREEPFEVRDYQSYVVGTWSEARYGKELAVLRKFIGERGLTAVGEPVFARYDPPFMPWFLRRNEIQIPGQGPAAR
jgi:SOUL heme-binding protein